MAATKQDRRYHAFLSFRGSDTRLGFVSHLIYAFLDDRKLPKGGSISLEIVEAIRDSILYVVVLSANYASSPWCLDELREITEHARSREGVVVVPVFYNVDPSDVEEVSGSFGAAMAKHATSVREETVTRWRDALTYVSGICGWDSRNRSEADLISDIVRDVSDKVNCAYSDDSSDLVGIGAHVEEMLKKLNVNSDSVHIVGLWGMGGIGKSTIARVVHDKLRSKFGACCYIADVGRKFLRGNGEVALRKELLSAIYKEKDLTGWPLHDSNIIKKRLCSRNVLVVLDAVDDLRQLRLLAKERSWFGPGSRIIITTRDRDLLTAHGVDIYEVKPLAIDAALQLFSRCAFKQNQPKDGYLELSHQFVSYAEGNPFALEILGSSQSNKSVTEWRTELDKLNRIPDRTISEMLKVSIDGLEELEKEVFLDIACFFNGMDRDTVADILDACGFIPERAFNILRSRALIRFLRNQLNMNKLHGQVGQQIVKEESKDPGGRSRLFDPDDIRSCLTGSMGSIKVEGIFFDMSKSEIMPLRCEAFANMSGLRLFNFYHPQYNNHLQHDRQTCNVQLQVDNSVSICQELKYFRWDAFPAKVLPLGFCARYLVELHMPYSNIEVLWEEKQSLMYLKVIDLKHSDLTKLPDLSEAKKLKHLNLQNCRRLVDVSSVEHVNVIEYLNLHACCYLNCLPSLAGLEALTTLDLSDCSNIQTLPPLPINLKYIYLRKCTMLTNLGSIDQLKDTKQVDIAGCTQLLQPDENTTERSSTTSMTGHSSDKTTIGIFSNAYVASACSSPVNGTIEAALSSQAQIETRQEKYENLKAKRDTTAQNLMSADAEIDQLRSTIAKLQKQLASEQNRKNCCFSIWKIHEDSNLNVQENMIRESATGSLKGRRLATFWICKGRRPMGILKKGFRRDPRSSSEFVGAKMSRK